MGRLQWIYPNLAEACIRRFGTANRMADALDMEQGYLSELMRGRHEPSKPFIDKVLAATGLTYEEAFKK